MTTTKHHVIIDTCPICIEDNRVQIECAYCNFHTCMRCQKKYLLDTVKEPHCMNCQKRWSRELLIKYFDKGFVDKELRNHYSEILFQQQYALLPETQPYVRNEKKVNDLQERLQMVNEELDRLEAEKRNLKKELSFEKHRQESYIRGHQGDQKYKSPTLSIKCPVEECKGFLGDDFNCGLCEADVCRKCLVIKKKDENGDKIRHICDPDLIDTVKLIRSDCKSCPKCKIPIHKLSGCSQIFCTRCHITFDWKTGKQTFERIHNPHYYEMQAQLGLQRREPGDVPCGGLIGHDELKKITTHCSTFIKPRLATFHRLALHIRLVEMPRHQNTPGKWEIFNRKYRIQYLAGNLTNDGFKRNLVKNHKESQRLQEIYDVLDMYASTLEILFRDAYQSDRSMIGRYYDQMVQLQIYTDENIKRIQEMYNSTAQVIRFELN